ncbi:MAG: plastocyanin/azurin family copper-binding protein [Thermoflexales bacterium]|nr:plastocyanin/azurin family copper-binding protein [Thermoflexales bacterium]MCS7325222.1 plastocyanin/azurin family copper-binding protein [Thermoflexales bacterium]MCX7939953.1 plastocyanin/azurin family copper-binding protein [Thermoflexales bacterium]MDW8053352.1 plastocyanin/azurin family copper-binding protein [Anaerolineae bacterium]MDW8292005.1 plastocyanin/azurin family copper-binding protein [Anaerolineae bacterium]
MSHTISRREALKAITLLSGAALLAACGGGGEAQQQQPQQPAAQQAVTLEISTKGNELYYDKNELRAPAGSKITLVFKNAADPNSGLLHNWVLVRPGTADAVANDGIAAGEANGYLKPGDNRVLAHTKMIKPGESDTITFDAPPAGSYDYICTFPGHAVLMRGKLIIQ